MIVGGMMEEFCCNGRLGLQTTHGSKPAALAASGDGNIETSGLLRLWVWAWQVGRQYIDKSLLATTKLADPAMGSPTRTGLNLALSEG